MALLLEYAGAMLDVSAGAAFNTPRSRSDWSRITHIAFFGCADSARAEMTGCCWNEALNHGADCRVLVSGTQAEANSYCQIIRSAGVPVHRIDVDPLATDTNSNIVTLSKLMADQRGAGGRDPSAELNVLAVSHLFHLIRIIPKLTQQLSLDQVNARVVGVPVIASSTLDNSDQLAFQLGELRKPFYDWASAVQASSKSSVDKFLACTYTNGSCHCPIAAG